MITVRKTLLVAALALFAATLPAQDFVRDDYAGSSLGYQLTEDGYIDAPMQTAAGLVFTSNRHSEIYLLRDGQLLTLVSSRGCGRYMQLNADKTLLGFKLINDYGEQAPAVLDLATLEVKQLEPFSNQCGQVSFGPKDEAIYTVGKQLIMQNGKEQMRRELGFYTNTLALSPSGICATANADQQPLFIMQDGKQQLLSAETGFYSPIWSPDGEYVVYQRNRQELYVFSADGSKMYCLGKGFGAKWLNGKELVFCRSEYYNDDVFFFEGISVCRSHFDGTGLQVLIDHSMECPQEIAVVDEEHIAVPFSAGDRRLSLVSLTNPAKEEVLYRLPMNEPFGRVHAPVMTPASYEAVNGNIGVLDIPYINQVHDVPTYQGSFGYGPCACAPSTACMLLGYYHQLPTDKKVLSRAQGRPWGKYNYYSWYVGVNYTSVLTNYTFNLEHVSSCDPKPASGGYGYMWNGGSPSSKMANFYIHNGVTSAIRDEAGFASILKECKEDRPYSWCVTSSKTNGHLILPFYAHTECFSDGTLASRGGCVVVHDPYGNANGSPWGGSDGRHVTYDAEGYNNGHLVMYNAWGNKVQKGNPIPDETALEDLQASSLRYENGVVLNPQGLNLTVYNAAGVLVASGCGNISLESFAPGLYLISAPTDFLKVLK